MNNEIFSSKLSALKETLGDLTLNSALLESRVTEIVDSIQLIDSIVETANREATELWDWFDKETEDEVGGVIDQIYDRLREFKSLIIHSASGELDAIPNIVALKSAVKELAEGLSSPQKLKELANSLVIGDEPGISSVSQLETLVKDYLDEQASGAKVEAPEHSNRASE